MISDKVYNLCRSAGSVSSELAKNPEEAPWKIAKHLYGSTGEDSTGKTLEIPAEYNPDDLERALECGNWGQTRPSSLFLKVCIAVIEYSHTVMLTMTRSTMM
jgi:hypothetical protein